MKRLKYSFFACIIFFCLSACEDDVTEDLVIEEELTETSDHDIETSDWQQWED